MMDFWELETISFPPEGSTLTPAHHFSEFRFKIYAPIAFRYFRDLFGIQPDDFLVITIYSILDSDCHILDSDLDCQIIMLPISIYSCQCARHHCENYPIQVHRVLYST